MGVIRRLYLFMSTFAKVYPKFYIHFKAQIYLWAAANPIVGIPLINQVITVQCAINHQEYGEVPCPPINPIQITSNIRFLIISRVSPQELNYQTDLISVSGWTFLY